MKQYMIYESPVGLKVALKVGYSWPAFFFTWLWAFTKNMKAIGGGFLLVYVIFFLSVAFISDSADQHGSRDLSYNIEAWIPIAEIALHLVFGAKGNAWRERNLLSRGYQLKAMISEHSVEGAIALHAKHHTEKES
jgi:hypothetical protein